MRIEGDWDEKGLKACVLFGLLSLKKKQAVKRCVKEWDASD